MPAHWLRPLLSHFAAWLRPLEGALFAQTTLFHGTQSMDVSGFLGPASPVWRSQDQQINREVAQRTLATLRAEAEHQ